MPMLRSSGASASQPAGYRPSDAYEAGPAPAPPPPDDYIPGSTYVPPSAAPVQSAPATAPEMPHFTAPPVAPGVNMPGPPRNYVPGSAYIPHPGYLSPSQPATPPSLDPAFVPGSGVYHPELRPSQKYIPAGLGAGTVPRFAEEPRISPLYAGLGAGAVPDRPRAPRALNEITPLNPAEPQHPIPGSSYAPDYFGAPPLGDPRRVWVDPTPSLAMGRPTADNPRPTSDKTGSVVYTTYPGTGAPETMRGVPREGEYLPLTERPIDATVPRQQNLAEVMSLMEWMRKQRRDVPGGLRGLFGGDVPPSDGAYDDPFRADDDRRPWH